MERVISRIYEGPESRELSHRSIKSARILTINKPTLTI